MPERVSRVVHRFWELLDSETVRLFVWPFYMGLLAWGIYATFWAQPIAIVESVLGHTFYNLWVWTCVAGTLSVMIGLTLRHGGKSVAEMTTPMLLSDYIGLWMQLGGHICMGLVLLAFEVSAIQGAYFGQAVFSVFVIAPYTMGCGFLALQTARKLWHGEHLHRNGGDR